MPKEIKKTIKKAEVKAVVKKTVKKAEIKPVIKAVKTPVVKAPEKNIAKYVNKNIMISPRKLRLLVNNIKKMSPSQALISLKFTNTKAARIMVKALQNIIADAKNNFNLIENTLKFDLIKVDEAMKIKRMDKSHSSRFARGLIQKRHSRLVIHVKGQQK